MAVELVAVELIRPWKSYRAGRILKEITPGVAEILVRRKVAKVIENELQRNATDQPSGSDSSTGNRATDTNGSKAASVRRRR